MAARVSILLFVYASVLIFSLSAGMRSVSNWNYTHWLFNYNDGVLRRALIGTLINIGGGRIVEHQEVFLMTLCIAYTFAFFLAGLVILIIYRSQARENLLFTVLILTYVLSCSGAVQQYFYDLGRFDVFGGIILTLGVAFILSVSSLHLPQCSVALLVILTVLAVLAVLIHEAFLFWVAPFFLAFWYFFSEGRRRDLGLLICSLLLLVVFALLVIDATYSKLLPLDQAIKILAARSDRAVSGGALMIHYRTLVDSISHGAGKYFSLRQIIGLPVAILVLVPQVVIYCVLFSKLRSSSEKAPRWLSSLVIYLAPLFPLLLSGLGHDIGRWVAMMSVSLVLGALIFISRLRWLDFSQNKILYSLMLVSIVMNLTQASFGTTKLMPDAGLIHIGIIFVEEEVF